MSAQERLRSIPDLWELAPPSSTSGAFSWIGDITGDGIDDFVVTQPTLSTDGLLLNGRVRVHSGVDASVLYTFTGTASFQVLGLQAAGFGDLDGDKVPDFLGCRFPGGPVSFAWSGADGSELRRIETFDSSCDLGDLDGDGVPSFATSYGSPDFVLVYDGLEVRYRLESPPGAIGYGRGLEGLGDLDGDGWADFAASAPGGVSKQLCEQGQVFVHSGRTGDLLYSIEGRGEPSAFGSFLASTGDVTGDGFQDLAIASPLWEGDCLFGGGIGQIAFHDGRTGAQLGVFDHTTMPIQVVGQLGRIMETVGDLNGNGYDDVVTLFLALWNNQTHRLTHTAAIDGGTRELIYVVPHPYGDDCTGYGYNLLPAGDVNDDGFPDFTAGVACNGSPDSRFDILSGAPLGVKSFGKPCKSIEGPEPRIGVSGLPLVGSDFRLYLSKVAPGQDAVLVLGTSNRRWGRMPLPLRLPGGCLLRVSADQRIPARASRIRPGAGAAEVAFPIPDDPALVGTSFFAQWLLRPSPLSPGPRGISSPGGFPLHAQGSTRALAITIRAEALPPLPPPALEAGESPTRGTGNDNDTLLPTSVRALLRGRSLWSEGDEGSLLPR